MNDNVVQIGDLLIKRKQERRYRADERCPHTNMTWDDNGCVVTCDACKVQLSPYWVMQLLASNYERAMRAIEAKAQRVAEEIERGLHLIAAKKVERVWRTRTMVPCCPHCGCGILPEDGLGGSQIARNFELAARQRRDGYKPGAFGVPPKETTA